jgi:uncharacterized membrane protein
VNRWNLWEKILFGAFLFWSAAGLIFTIAHFDPAAVARWPVPAGLAAFVEACLFTGDPILILLAFANSHLHAARQWNPALARRWALLVLVCALAVETLGVYTGFPFGSYRYTHRFGPLLGVVPLTIPLAWHVVVTNAWFLARAFARSRLAQATLTGAICTLYDFILEPFATGPKHYWMWQNGQIPLQNYIAWFFLSGLLAWFFAPQATPRYPRDPRPALLLGLTLLIFAAGRL